MEFSHFCPSSDVHLVLQGNEIRCLECRLLGGSQIIGPYDKIGLQAALDHLEAHREVGHNILYEAPWRLQRAMKGM